MPFAKTPHECKDRDITIRPAGVSVSVRFNGRIIARSDRALDLAEGDYPIVSYLPISDVRADVLALSDHHSVCPFKGKAAYWHLVDGAERAENAVWYYDEPCPLVAPIKDHVAFWGDKIAYVRA
ncbi:MAG: DUF427 domain-containing protein [Alphaproteobacteria bacterium]|nr:DUF427 domain-containing protein [Alphaproteobacteria bacterium]